MARKNVNPHFEVPKFTLIFSAKYRSRDNRMGPFSIDNSYFGCVDCIPIDSLLHYSSNISLIVYFHDFCQFSSDFSGPSWLTIDKDDLIWFYNFRNCHPHQSPKFSGYRPRPPPNFRFRGLIKNQVKPEVGL